MKPAATKFLGTLLVGLGLIAAALGTFLSAQNQTKLAATAVVQIERDESDLPSLGNRMPAGSDLEYILKTETELISSALILDPVIESLNLNDVFGKLLNDGQKLKTSESREHLRYSIQATAVTGESRFAITVTRSSAEDPVKIANAVAQSYCDYRADRRKRIAETSTASFAAPFKEAEAPFLLAKQNLESAREELPPDLRTNPPQIATGENSPALRDAQASFNQLTFRMLVVSNQLAGLKQTGAADTNSLARAADEFSKLQAALPLLESKVNAESKQLEALRNFALAKEKFDSAEKSFAPFRKKAEEIRAINSPDKKPAATVIESATNATTVSTSDISRGTPAFIAAGLLLLVGVPMVLSVKTKPAAQ
jgi:capsular polysaccharide biosynthesis protein